ncbi:sensor histidine kinase [Niabella sp. CJ426]|uniref:sensor histidine kinase n=1 Tax=Niabella sp. CJ426 TaxID=3393740 RepID=UPI003D0282BC
MRKKQYLKKYARTRQWFNNIVNIGLTPELSFEEARRVRILNVMAMMGLLISTTFVIIHFSNDRVTLGLLNVVTMLSTGTIIIANYKKRYYFGQVAVSIALTFVFTSTSLLYHDGMEFYLLLLTALMATIMKGTWFLRTLSIINCVIFLVLIKRSAEFYTPTPGNIYFINLVLLVMFYLVFFRYSGKINRLYLANIEERNHQLRQQQARLIEQTEELEISNRKLAVLNSTKEKLFSILAHDVRSPIAGLKTSLDLLNEKALSRETFTELSHELSSQLNELQDSMDNLLKWSNRQMTGMELQPQKIMIEPLIADTIGLLQYNLANKNINVNISIETDATIYADPDHIKLVMRNLISNAIKFSYAGNEIDLLVEHKDSLIHFSVIDKGIGMKKDLIEKLFNEADVTSQRGTSNEKGTGMGLKISREFAVKNGGDILIYCEPGSGCTFTLTIPVAVTNPIELAGLSADNDSLKS